MDGAPPYRWKELNAAAAALAHSCPTLVGVVTADLRVPYNAAHVT